MLSLVGKIWKVNKFWLMPVLFALVLLGGLKVLATGNVVPPFLYTRF